MEINRFRQLFRRAPERSGDDKGFSGRERRDTPRPPPREGIKVLIADDSRTIVALLRKMLEQNDYVVLEASDGEEAVSRAVEEQPHLIFLDIVMPGVNGFAALRTLRRNPETADIPIIMISGNEQATEEFYVQRIGADDFMKKPFSRAEVFARVDGLLDEKGIPRRRPAEIG